MNEEVTIVYNVAHEEALGPLIALYFYMTGLSAGSFILSTLAYGFGIKRYKPLGKIGVVLATVLLVLAPLNLIADLGQPWRFWHLFPYLNFTSPITYGTFLLTIYPLNCVVYAFFMFRGNERMTRLLGLIGVPLAVSVHGYTGFIMALAKARALWNTALMPILFLVSAMVSGIALMILVVTIVGFLSKQRRPDPVLVGDLGKILAGSILLDLFLVFSDILVLLTSDSEAGEAAMLILQGGFSSYFLGVEILAGSLVPLVLLVAPAALLVRAAVVVAPPVMAATLVSLGTLPLSPLGIPVMAASFLPLLAQGIPQRHRPLPATVAASVLVMVGILAMRYVVVVGGQHVPLS
ncbi:MAG: NrfD/PsrC family molybdoenzyme membrane anchor subunit [Chloroflexota bacterium]